MGTYVDNLSKLDQQVKDWRIGCNMILLYSRYDSIKELEEDWDKFEGMEREDQYISDDESLRLFNKTNNDRYEEMLHKFYSDPKEEEKDYNKEYTPPNKITIDPLDRLFLCREMAIDENYLDNVNKAKFIGFIQEANSDFNLTADIDSIKSDIMSDLESSNLFDDVGVTFPFLSLEAMSDNEGNISIIDDDHAKWLDGYKRLMTIGDKSRYTPNIDYWKRTVQNVYDDYSKAKENDDEKKDFFKYRLVSLGWVPDIKPTPETIEKASDTAKQRIKEVLRNTSIIDVPDTDGIDLSKEKEASPYLYIVCRKNNDTYTMIALASNKELNDAVEVGYNYTGNSCTATPLCKKVSLNAYDDSDVDIYTIIKDALGAEDINKIMVTDSPDFNSPFYGMTGNIKSFNAGGLKLFLRNLFRAYTFNALDDDKTIIYKIFSGNLGDYRKDYAVDKLKAINTSLKKEARMNSGLTESATNEFPIEFDKDGNLLISKGKNLDIDGEYSRTHLALKMYQEGNNIKGMKYCICKLWYLNIVLEDKIHDKRTKEEERKKCIKSRAKVMNDIKKYTPILIKADPGFDILKTYQNSPFNNDKVSIKSSTLFYMFDTIKKFLSFKNLLK